MAVLAVITVHRCDACGRLVSLQTEAQYHTFAHTWYEGWELDFCEVCRHTEQAQIKITDDIAKNAAIEAAVRKYGTKEVRDYVN